MQTKFSVTWMTLKILYSKIFFMSSSVGFSWSVLLLSGMESGLQDVICVPSYFFSHFQLFCRFIQASFPEIKLSKDLKIVVSLYFFTCSFVTCWPNLFKRVLIWLIWFCAEFCSGFLAVRSGFDKEKKGHLYTLDP